MPDPNSFVVPANAGTHTPCSIVSNAHSENFLLNKRRWLWVPAFALGHAHACPSAFAGTTMEEQHSRHLRRHCERSEAIHSSFFAPRDGLLRFARNDVAPVTNTRSRPAARFARGVHLSLASLRAWGMPDAQCTRGLVCNDSDRTHTSNNEYTGITRHSRTQWF